VDRSSVYSLDPLLEPLHNSASFRAKITKLIFILTSLQYRYGHFREGLRYHVCMTSSNNLCYYSGGDMVVL